MASTIDDICKKILQILGSNTTDFALLQRSIGAGSMRTIKNHVKHLEEKGLVQVKKERRGIRDYYRISLTKKGADVAAHLSKEKQL